MKFVKFEVDGYKRFNHNNKVQISEKLVAIVGPNEAGKTSLLSSINHLNSEPFVEEGSSQELTRGREFENNEVICKWTFAIDAGDRKALIDIPEAENLRWYILEKRIDGKLSRHLIPKPKRTMDRRIQAKNTIEEFLKEKADKGIDAEQDELKDVVRLSEFLESDEQALSKEIISLINSVASKVQNDDVLYL